MYEKNFINFGDAPIHVALISDEQLPSFSPKFCEIQPYSLAQTITPIHYVGNLQEIRWQSPDDSSLSSSVENLDELTFALLGNHCYSGKGSKGFRNLGPKPVVITLVADTTPEYVTSTQLDPHEFVSISYPGKNVKDITWKDLDESFSAAIPHADKNDHSLFTLHGRTYFKNDRPMRNLGVTGATGITGIITGNTGVTGMTGVVGIVTGAAYTNAIGILIP